MAGPLSTCTGMHIAIVGGGWAGLSAAVRAVTRGHRVTLMEMSAKLGGRARTVELHGQHLDNGQHILIGAYRETLTLLRKVGVDPGSALLRLPLSLTTPDGQGIKLDSPSSPAAFCWAVMRHPSWSLTSRFAILRASAGWAAKGFRCPPDWTVETLARRLPREVRHELIDPLCVSALNTLPQTASALVFLRVLKDALMQQSGSADLLLPRRPLSELMPEPALNWLQARGALVRLRHRVNMLEPVTGHKSLPGHQKLQGHWLMDGEAFDHVVLACPAYEAARLTRAINPDWSGQAQRLPQSAITTVYLSCPGARLRAPMVFLPEGPAQFAFDHGAMGMQSDRFAFVISASETCPGWRNAQWAQAVLGQARQQFPAGTWPQDPQVTGVVTEHRATFRCGTDVVRPPYKVAPGLWAAGDYIHGPYPSTLEGAVRSGQEVIDGLA